MFPHEHLTQKGESHENFFSSRHLVRSVRNAHSFDLPSRVRCKSVGGKCQEDWRARLPVTPFVGCWAREGRAKCWCPIQVCHEYGGPALFPRALVSTFCILSPCLSTTR